MSSKTNTTFCLEPKEVICKRCGITNFVNMNVKHVDWDGTLTELTKHCTFCTERLDI